MSRPSSRFRRTGWWFDRAGKPLGALGPPGAYSNLALSPDGTRAAVGSVDAQTGSTDIWIVDGARGVPTRFTFDRMTDRAPVWSPDGSQLVFQSDRDGLTSLYRKDSSGAASDGRLLQANGSPEATDWSSDGRFLLYWANAPKTGYDLWVLPDPTGDPGNRKPVPFLQTAFDETQGQFSPGPADAPRWVAYTSNESGSYEIYVQSFPAGSGKFQISSSGGTQPRWRRDGKELFYLAGDGKLMAVEVKTAPKFWNGAPKPLFDPQLFTSGVPQFPFRYDVSPDGKRFLVVSALHANQALPSPITVVVNWTAGLRR